MSMSDEASANAGAIKGPVSCFPSIENKCGQPIARWLAELQQLGADLAQGDCGLAEVGSQHVTATPIRC